ncbi:MAG TPA: hypothetical protein VK151_16435 [Fluviicola sp.]|nr:hypothetical protein [Fluviicola sp.]
MNTNSDEAKQEGFKLLAIRILTGCNPRFYKNLKQNLFYSFYQEHEFSEKRGVTFYKHKPNRAADLYDINGSDDKKIKISISAIIGKNGSGKSTLTELFYLYVFLCNYKQIMTHKIKSHNESLFDIQFDESFNTILDNNLTNNWYAQSASYKEQSFFDELVFFKDKNAVFEVYYLFENEVFQVAIDTRLKDDINWFSLNKWNNNRFRASNTIDIVNPIPFYSIALNYSIHGLNTLDHGAWLDRIFHKNDGYQTPLVINPKREEGNIDINNENELQKSRLLANIIVSKSKGLLDNVVFNKKRFQKIQISFSKKAKYTFPTKDILLLLDLNAEEIKSNGHRDTIRALNGICAFYKIPNYDELKEVEKLTLRYIANKLSKITKTYFKETGERYNLSDITRDTSHVTYKLIQSINFIRGNSSLKDRLQSILEGQIQELETEFENIEFLKTINIDFNDIYETISVPYGKSKEALIQETDLIHYLLPPIFDYNIFFSNSPSDNLNNLSSGEKQQMYTLHTIMYHIRNLSSKPSNHSNKYRHINLILDEIELYYHPELQRQFIYNLLNHIEKLHLDTKDIQSINILLATHSPFITSDIVSQNILRLENGEPKKIEAVQSFGSNIHDLLADGFYLSNFLGEFAKFQIEAVIKFLNNPKRNTTCTKEKASEIIELIGDPIIKNRLNDLYLEAYPSDRPQSLIEEKEELLKKLAEIDELIKEENDQN